MDHGSFARLSAILDEVLELPAAERPARVAELCGEEPQLRARAERLLAADAEAGGPLDGCAEAYASALAADPAAEPARAVEGLRCGPYRLVGELGRGGMGVVYLGERTEGGFAQRVAVKVIKRGMDSEEILARFLGERQILADLEHPGIARLLDGGLGEDGRPFFAMEYVEGLPITRYCGQRNLSIPDRLRLFESVCRAVEYAHRNLVVHRDLKPANILVTPAGEVKLLDFGIAKLLDRGRAAPGLTRASLGPMTPEYAAPEQVRGGAVTTATDVWGLGMVLYELLTGGRPFAAHGGEPEELERAILERDPERPSSAARRRDTGAETRPARPRGGARRRDRGFTGDLDALVLTALRKDPGRRYPSAAALREDIGRYLEGLPLAAHPDSFGYRARKFVGRHRLAVGAASLSALSLLGGLAGTAWQARVARAEAARATTVKNFLVGLFEVADPDVRKGQEISARMLLDRGAARLDRELEAAPALQEEMLGLLGELYLKLGMLERAAPLLERDLTLTRRLFGAAHVEVARSEERLAALRRAQGRLPEAEVLLRRALATYRGAGAAAETGRTLAALAELLSARGEAAEAEPLFEEARELLAETAGPRSAEMAEALNGKALLLAGRGDLAGAVPLLEEALAIRRQIFGEKHSRVAQSLANLAVVRVEQGDLEAAEQDLRQVLALHRQLYGDEHPVVADDLGNLGATLVKLHRYAEAEALLRSALAMQEKLLGADHPQLGLTCFSLGGALVAEGRFAEAVPLLRRAAALNRKLVGDDHPQQARILELLERALKGSR